MHNTHDYSKLKGPMKRARAVLDILDFMGQQRFEMIWTQFAHTQIRLSEFEMYCSIAGIQGYPVQAFYETIYGESEYDRERAKVIARDADGKAFNPDFE